MKILVADDQPMFRRLIEAALQTAGHEVVLAQDGRQAWEALTRGEYDLAVLDWMMPEMDGPTLCRELRRRLTDRYLYIILLTAKDEFEDVVKGLDSGADEYLVKPFNPEELRARVRAGGRVVELERRLSQANAQLGTLAATDELTGLMNRRAILGRLEEETGRSPCNSCRLSVIMADLDDFKRINDEHGHAVGDAVLRELCGRLRPLLRPYDSLGRLGGDELLVLLPGASEGEALAAAERMRAALASRPVVLETGKEGSGAPCAGHVALALTASFGVAELDRTSATETALSIADQALYQAKGRGGNCVVAASLLVAAPEQR